MPSFLHRLRAHLHKRGVNPIDLFSESDRRRVGSITLDSLIRSLFSIGFIASDADISEIKTSFSKNGFVDYVSIANALESSQNITSQAEISQTDLAAFASDLSAKCLRLSDVLTEYDPTRTSFVSANSFLRALGNFHSANTVANVFADPSTNEIDYEALQQRLDLLTKSPSRQSIELPPIFAEFVRLASARGIKPIDSFLASDTRKQGFLEKSRFMSILASFGLPLSPEEINSLTTPFINDRGFVLYHLFSKEFISASRQATHKAVQAKQAPIGPVLEFIRKQIQSRRLDIIPEFQKYDDKRSGFLPKARFYKVLSFLGFPLSCEEALTFNSDFSDGENINYLKFTASVCPPPPKIVPICLNEVEDRIKKSISSSKKSLYSSLSSFDMEDSGFVSIPQLASALSSIGFFASKGELQVIGEEYGKKAMIEWRRLCNIVDPHPMKEKEEIHIQSEIIPFSAVSASVVKLKRVINKEDLERDFATFDPKRTGEINEKKFREVIEALPFRISEEEIRKLEDYCRSEKSGQIQYILVLAGYDRIVTSERPNLPQKKEAPKKVGCEEVLKKMKVALINRRLPPEELFSDSSRSGTVTKDAFKYSMSPLMSFLDSDDVTILSNEFCDTRFSDRVNYRKLCAELKCTDVGNEELFAVTQSRIYGVASDSALRLAIHELREKLLMRRIRPSSLFDGIGSKLIPPEVFRERLQRLDIIISEDSVQQFIHAFTRSRSNLIDWQRFCSEIESTHDFLIA